MYDFALINRFPILFLFVLFLLFFFSCFLYSFVCLFVLAPWECLFSCPLPVCILSLPPRPAPTPLTSPP